MRTTPSRMLVGMLLWTPAALAQTAPSAPQLAPLPPAATPAAPATNAPPADPNAVLIAPPPPPSAEVAYTPAPPMPVEASPRVRRLLRHEGFYLGAGTGAGSVGVFGHGPNGSASIAGFGSTSTFAIGGTITRGLALVGWIEGGTTSGTFNGGPQVTATTTHVVNGQTVTTTGGLSGHASANTFLLGVALDWYPNPDDGWHAGGALGLGGASVTDDANNTSSGVSAAASLFGGYQWWLGPSWSLGLSVVLTGAPTLKMSDSNQDDTGYRLAPLAVSLQSLLLYY